MSDLCVCGHVYDEHGDSGQCDIEDASTVDGYCPCAGFEEV